MQAGADLCINSTHKMLGSMSQTAMLHVQGNRIRLDRLKAVYKLFLSTSPNLVLVASLDVARRQMALDGPALLSRTIEIANDARRGSTRSRASTASAKNSKGGPACSISIRRRSPITVKNLGYTGYEAEEILRRRYNVQVELADSLQRASRSSRSARRPKLPTARARRARARARRSSGRHLLAVGRARAANEHRHVQAAEDPADPARPARRVSGRDRVRAVQDCRRAASAPR